MKKLLIDEKGLALAMVLVLSAIALAIMAGLIYMVTSGTQVSGLQKRYKTALEAGKGGADIVFDTVAARSLPSIPGLPITSTNPPCLAAKLLRATSAANWAACGNLPKAMSMTIDPADVATYDFSFDLWPGAVLDPKEIYRYRVYAKIADTIEGNTAPESGWIQGGVVWSKSEFFPVSRPYYYTIEIDVEKFNAPTPEKARLSILYQH